MNINIDSCEGSEEDSEVRGSKRTARRVGAGIAAGLIAAIGLGLAIQSPISAAQVNDSPSGAQLPWDDYGSADGSADESNLSVSPGRDPMHNGGRHADRNGSPGGHRDGHRSGLRDGGARDGARMGGPRELIALAAKTLGITPEELMTELKAGKSVADVASERDIPVQDVIDALVDEVVSNATERITELVNRKPQTPGSDTPES